MGLLARPSYNETPAHTPHVTPPGEIYTPLDGTLMSEETYLRKHGLEGAFVKEYRDGDSGFASARPQTPPLSTPRAD